MNVSVVLPVYNDETTVGRAIESILTQSHRDLQLIVVDDGSTDASVDVVRRYSDSRLTLVQLPHVGVVGAANEGAKHAQASFIARMDADDFSYPKRIASQLQYLLRNNLDVVGCKIHIVDPHQQPIPSMRRYQDWINDDTRTPDQIMALRFVEFPLVNPTILARREYFDLQFQENGFPEDYDLMLRAASTGMRFGKVDEVLFQWVDHPDSLTRTHARYSDEAFMRCRRHHLLNGPLRERAAVDLWGLGKTGKIWLRWLQSQGIQVRRAYAVAERKVGQMIHDVSILHASDLALADNVPLIVAVGTEGARADISPQLLAKGFRIGKDAWFVA